MRKSQRWLLIALIALFSTNSALADVIKREMRSVWIATVANIDWPKTKGNSQSVIQSQKDDLIDYIDRMDAMNINTICFQVRSMCDAMYKSSYEPWSSYLTGTRGKDPGWDPLQFMVDECHKRGIEVYAWVNPYRWSSTGTTSTWNTDFDTEVKNKGWLLTNGTFTVLNPAFDETRQHIVNVCKEIITNYSVEGMIFDDYFYPVGGMSENSSAPDYQLWKDSGTSLSIGDWRRENVDKMVADVYNMVQETRPEVRFGIAPPGTAGESASKYGLSIWKNGYDTQYTSLYSDPLSWMSKGIVDYVSPQIYWHNDHRLAPFGTIAKWWYSLAKHFGNCHCNISVNIYDLAQSMGYQAELGNTQAHWDEHVRLVKQSREFAAEYGLNAFGSNFYSITYFRGTFAEHADYVATNCFPQKALVPVVDWKTAPSYSAVANLLRNGNTLSWTGIKDGLSTIRYTVYAVPMSLSRDAATTDDGLNGEYLLDITYAPSYDIPTDKQTGYWYAVCVYDGYGNEHPAAIVGYPEGNSDKVTLLSPINGAKATWEQEFAWTAIDNGTYNLYIGTDKNGNIAKHAVTGLTSNSTTIDLSEIADFTDNSTYYWKVVSYQPNKLEATSEVASFTSPARQLATPPTLVAPDNGADIENEVDFVWSSNDDNITSFVVQVSSNNEFGESTTKSFSATANQSLTIPASTIGLGTYYWQVIGKGKRCLDTPSDARSFTITNTGVGFYEPGYEIKYDTGTYPAVDNLELKSLWMRTNDYQNIVFAGSGTYNRSIVAVGDYVYITGRTENSATATAFLEKYSALTGEHIGRLTLGKNASVGFYPCNNVMKDSDGEVFISNLTITNDTPLFIHHVNLETGETTEVAQLTATKYPSGRFDHVAIIGQGTKGNFSVFAVAKDTGHIFRWTISNGNATEEMATATAFYPTSATSFGLAPQIIPVSTTDIFIDGASTALTRYSFPGAQRTGSFLANTSVAPESTINSGATIFPLGNAKVVIYANGDHSTTPSHSFKAVITDSDISFTQMKELWTLTQYGFGTVNSATFQADADHIVVAPNKVRFYLFVPGNGICAYEICDTSMSEIDDITTDNNAPIEFYNLQGVKVNANHLSSGIYIKKQGNKTTKILIR